MMQGRLVRLNVFPHVDRPEQYALLLSWTRNACAKAFRPPSCLFWLQCMRALLGYVCVQRVPISSKPCRNSHPLQSSSTSCPTTLARRVLLLNILSSCVIKGGVDGLHQSVRFSSDLVTSAFDMRPLAMSVAPIACPAQQFHPTQTGYGHIQESRSELEM